MAGQKKGMGQKSNRQRLAPSEQVLLGRCCFLVFIQLPTSAKDQESKFETVGNYSD